MDIISPQHLKSTLLQFDVVASDLKVDPLLRELFSLLAEVIVDGRKVSK